MRAGKNRERFEVKNLFGSEINASWRFSKLLFLGIKLMKIYFVSSTLPSRYLDIRSDD